MSGNVWEWCQDVFTRDVTRIPQGPLSLVLAIRVSFAAAAFTTGAVQCTVSKRYEMARDYHDGCIGLRFVFSIDTPGGAA